MASILPPFGMNRPDEVVWKDGKDNMFTVTSTYKVVEGEHMAPTDRIWRSIWDWNGPHRLKTCLWIIANNKLLTNAERFKRHMTDTAACSLCNGEMETTLHAIRDCGKVRRLWEKLVPPLKWNDFFHGNLAEWLDSNLKGNYSADSVSNLSWSYTFIVAIWSIWRERNNTIFNGKDRNIEQVQFGIIHQVEEILNCNAKFANLGAKKTEALIGWNFPNDDWVKCNVDGACKDNGTSTGCGGVLRDRAEHWVTGFVRGLGMGTVLNAELWGILIGLQVAWNHGLRKVWLESDSLTAINLIKHGCTSSHMYYDLVLSIRELCNRSWQVHLSHIHREGNRVADSLANEGAASDHFTNILISPPFYCLNLLRDDTMGVSLPRFVPSVAM